MKVNKIITHAGKAHQDDTIAVALLLARNPNAEVVRVGKVSDDDMSDPEVAVVDIGMKHCPELHCYDHHQDILQVYCAVSLVLQDMGLYKDACDQWPWLEQVEIMDNHGPARVARDLGISTRDYLAAKGPAQLFMMEMFERDPDGCKPMLIQFGNWLLDGLQETIERRGLLSSMVPDRVDRWVVVNLQGVRNPTLATRDFGGWRTTPHILIIDNPRGEGVNILSQRAQGGPDLCCLEGHEDVSFVHAGGFLAVVPNGNWRPLVAELRYL